MGLSRFKASPGSPGSVRSPASRSPLRALRSGNQTFSCRRDMEINSVNSKYEDEQSLNSTLQRKLKEHQVCLVSGTETNRALPPKCTSRQLCSPSAACGLGLLRSETGPESLRLILVLLTLTSSQRPSTTCPIPSLTLSPNLPLPLPSVPPASRPLHLLSGPYSRSAFDRVPLGNLASFPY